MTGDEHSAPSRASWSEPKPGPGPMDDGARAPELRPPGEPGSGEAHKRGRLIVYLGAAPGVGKTFAMLDEARRRLARGTDIVVGLVETHGRPQTAAKLQGLELIGRKVIEYRGRQFTELDTAAVLARRPTVALVDELAHTNVPGSKNEKRWQDVEELLDAGINVITTVNIQHIESLNDDVAAITGVVQRETVPDEVVRAADQIQLVDISPQALRRRLAHGNIYRAEQIDASLSSYFREGNLTALRELALLWLADRVDTALATYRLEHSIEETWPVRERVVVAVDGRQGSGTLIRRGAKIASRSVGSQLFVVHVLATDGLPAAPSAALEKMRRLAESLGGTFHTVAAEDTATGVLDFATGMDATLIVVGVSRHSRVREALTESVSTELARRAGSIDVHLVSHEHARSGWTVAGRLSPLSRRRRVAGWLGALIVPWVLVGLMMLTGDAISLAIDLLVFLAGTVAVAIVGGWWSALTCAVLSIGLANFFFTPPTGRLTVSDPENVLALVIFVVIAAGVSWIVNVSARQSRQAYQARAESAALASLSSSVLSGEDTPQAVVDRLRETFSLEGVGLFSRTDPRSPWGPVAVSGDAPANPRAAGTLVPIDDNRLLALSGRPLPASDRRVVFAFANQAGLTLEYRRLREEANRSRTLEQAHAARTALLAAVSHDLRTPLATMRTAIDGLRSSDAELSDQDRRELVAMADEATGHLEDLIGNLLDLSRLQTDSITPILRAVSIDEIVPLAVAGLPAPVRLDIADTLPLVLTDPGLIERVVANVLANAARFNPPGGEPILVTAWENGDAIEVRVVDHGPGIPDDAKAAMFEPFQRLNDTSPQGLGLGLAVARGLAELAEASLTAEDTPGGGLTMVLRLPMALGIHLPAAPDRLGSVPDGAPAGESRGLGPGRAKES